MKESPFGFEYSWEDLKPIRPLAVTVFVAQFLGAGIGLWISKFPSWFDNAWAGAALATSLGFLLGLPIQMQMHPGSLSVNRVMVRRLGLIAMLLSALVFVIPFGTAGAR